MSYFVNKKFFATITSIVLLFIFIFPIISLAENLYTPLVRCGLPLPSQYAHDCDFNDFVDLINRIINWIISIAGVIFTISAVYGGFLYMTSGENPGNKEKAKTILWSTLTGFVIILVSWLIVYTLLVYLVDDSAGPNTIFKFLGGRKQ